MFVAIIGLSDQNQLTSKYFSVNTMPKSEVPTKPEKFKYVLIPADTLYPIEVRDFDQVSLEDDQLIKTIKQYFAMANPEVGVDREMLIKQMSEHAKKDITTSLDPTILEHVMSTTSVDILTIAVPSHDNNHTGVSLYCDDKGRSKNLRLNERMGGIANWCGLVGHTFHGDVFLSRMYDDGEDLWFRMNFDMSDVSSGAEWMKRAAEQASRKLTTGPTSLSGLAEQFMSRAGQSPAVLTDSGDSHVPEKGERENYKWYQTGDEIEVTVPVDASVTKAQISVQIKPKSIAIRVADKVIADGHLFDSVDAAESLWTFSQKDRLLQITLVKKSTVKMWSDLLQ